MKINATASDADGKVQLVELLENGSAVAKSQSARVRFSWAKTQPGITNLCACHR
jgi:hypothetical protein